ncbi:MAG: amino acid permease [Gemmatimonadetes bacterium]|nr:amino acid permease [Gemmatimonadota bacterium]
MALQRELGLFSAALVVVGGIIGSGIFFTPAATAAALPSAGWVVFVWALGGVVALAGALTYAELGAMLPEAGGAYVYIREAFGPLPAFLSAWMNAGLISSGAIAAVAMGFAGYLEQFVSLAAVGGPIGAAAITIVLLTATNILGIKPGVGVQNVLTIAKISALAGLIIGGVVLAFGAGPSPEVVVAAPPAAPSAAPSLLRGFASAFVAVLFTIGGWQQMNMIAGEIRDPARNIPRALGIGIAIVIAVYLGVTGAYLGALGRDGLAASAAPAAATAARIGGAAAATAITAAAMLSILGFVNVALLTNARVVYALGADVPALSAAGRVHARFGSPWVALLMLGGWSLVLLLATRGSIGTLLGGVVFADWIFFALGAASVFRLRALRPNAARPYRALGYPWLPAFFVAAGIVGIVSAYVSELLMSVFGTALLGVGALVWVVAKR